MALVTFRSGRGKVACATEMAGLCLKSDFNVFLFKCGCIKRRWQGGWEMYLKI